MLHFPCSWYFLQKKWNLRFHLYEYLKSSACGLQILGKTVNGSSEELYFLDWDAKYFFPNFSSY